MKGLLLKTKEDNQNYTFYCTIRELDVKEAFKRMKNDKTIELDTMPIVSIRWLTKLFNETMMSKKMRNILIDIYKNKCNIQNYGNYKGVKLTSHTMKIWEMIIERMLR
ncbi:hypothetical protein Lal_00032992 [Lupinus albus]|nr:hypothetical protein Lal_00032992 [Lupinus albus]